MPLLVTLLTALAGGAVALLWVRTLLRLARDARRMPVLGPDARPGPLGDVPWISVVIAAKDEEANIEGCVASVLAQDHPRFEVVVVNDRSSDRTGALLEALRAAHPDRLRVVTVTALPEGWGGQNHALQQGVKASAGEWLCFTDADCRWTSPRTLTVAFKEVEARRADLLSLLPRLEAPTLWERLYLPVCGLTFLTRLRIGEVNDPDSTASYANGAFMLVQRTVYDVLGGHARVRGQLNDDLALAQLAKEEGMRVRVAGNDGLCRTRMYGSLAQAWNGWTRNFTGSLQRAPALFAAATSTALLFVAPWLGLALALGWGAPAAVLAWGAAAGVAQVGLWLIYPSFGSPAAASLLALPGALFVAAIQLRAWGRALRRGPTVWHGVRYADAPRRSRP